jgi:DNA-binding MarR family transcriptional regulator
VLLDGMAALVGVAARSVAEISDDVSLVQVRVLVLLHNQRHQTMGGLADALGVNRSTATRVCERLEAKHLVRRRVDPDDRRSVHAELTRKGAKLVQQMINRRRAELESVLAQMTPTARDQLVAGLRAFADAGAHMGAHAWGVGWAGAPQVPAGSATPGSERGLPTPSPAAPAGGVGVEPRGAG